MTRAPAGRAAIAGGEAPGTAGQPALREDDPRAYMQIFWWRTLETIAVGRGRPGPRP